MKGFHDLSRSVKRKPLSGLRGIMPDAQQKGGRVKLAGFATLCPRGGHDEDACRNRAVARAFCLPLVEPGNRFPCRPRKCPGLALTSAVLLGAPVVDAHVRVKPPGLVGWSAPCPFLHLCAAELWEVSSPF